MILGMSIATFALVHVALSSAGLASGLVALIGMACGKKWDIWISLFLTTTVLTSVTGLLFRSPVFGLADELGVLSLMILAITSGALYVGRLIGIWRWIYVTGAVSALYLNVFAAVVTAFQFVPILRPLTPTLANPPLLIAQVVGALPEPSFLIPQLLLIIVFITMGISAAIRFPGETKVRT